jgi:hypothetical protein
MLRIDTCIDIMSMRRKISLNQINLDLMSILTHKKTKNRLNIDTNIDTLSMFQDNK